jgi:hypothetical protein
MLFKENLLLLKWSHKPDKDVFAYGASHTFQKIINRLARGTGCGIEPLNQTLHVSPVGPLGKPVQVHQSLSI